MTTETQVFQCGGCGRKWMVHGSTAAAVGHHCPDCGEQGMPIELQPGISPPKRQAGPEPLKIKRAGSK